jgi:hypothetical protein
VRQSAIERGLGAGGGFRTRGGEVSRVEGFSDAVFAFATTLLVVSLEVPRSFDDLIRTMQGFPAFGICFALLLVIWYAHYTFFRRYGLEDGPTILLNAVLLVLVLFYVYPLKFMFGAMVESVFGLGPGLAGSMTRAQGSVVLIVYGAGFVAVFLTLTLLYYRAWRARDRLGLDALERFDTRTSLQHYSLYVGIGLLSISIAAIGGAGASFWAGMSYFLLGPSAGFHGALRGRRRRELEQPA